MDWNAIGAIGQILGTTAVFIALGYLTIQLRYLRADAQRSVRQSRTEVMSQHMMTLATNERLAPTKPVPGIEQMIDLGVVLKARCVRGA